MSKPFEIVRVEASHWWRTNVVAGAILHRLMLLFIAVPVVLVAKGYFVLSIFVFLGMVPYGLLLRCVAERSLASFIEAHPETLAEFEAEGIVTRPGIQKMGSDP